MPCFPTTPSGAFSHQYADPSVPQQYPGFNRYASADRLSRFISVSCSATVAASVSCWAHIGQDVIIQPNTRRIQFVANPLIYYSVEATSWIGGYASAEALAHLVIWNAAGHEVGHPVASIYRAVATIWGWPRSGFVSMPVSLVHTINRTPTATAERWHMALGLQTWAGCGGFAAAAANASCTLNMLCAYESV